MLHAKRKGVGHIRMHFGYGVRTGWPDDVFLLPGGKPLFCEFKAPGKEPTAKQELRITELEKLGYEVAVCDNVEEGKELIDEYLYAIGSGNF